MSKTAGGQGEAPPVTAVTGPGVTSEQAVAVTLLEVASADEVLERMRDKVAKAKRQAVEQVDTATEGLAVAQTAAEAAMAAALAVIPGADESQVRELAGNLAAEHTRHQAALAKLAAVATTGGE
jgi:hypothetical protein